MGFNRIADRSFDARNPGPPTASCPGEALTLAQAWGSVIAASLLFFLAAGLLNPLCLWLSPLALAWILLYSMSKRFTWWPHLWLGMSLAIAPVGGYLAVTGRWSHPNWLLLAVTVAVATWVAGFDIFYALPDAAFDAGEGLRSAVVRLGNSRAILLAKLLHGITIPALALFGYWGGVWRLVLCRVDRGYGDSGLRASSGAAGRPVPAECGILHDERGDVAGGVWVCSHRPDHVTTPLPLVLALTGASGAPYGVRLLEILARNRIPVWLITSEHGMRLLQEECGIGSLDALRQATGGDWSSVGELS